MGHPARGERVSRGQRSVAPCPSQRAVDATRPGSCPRHRAGLKAALALGYRSVLSNRPDGEEPGQVSAAAAQRAGTPRSGGFANSVPGHPSGFIESTLISAFGGPRKEGEDPDARYVGGIRVPPCHTREEGDQ